MLLDRVDVELTRRLSCCPRDSRASNDYLAQTIFMISCIKAKESLFMVLGHLGCVRGPYRITWRFHTEAVTS